MPVAPCRPAYMDEYERVEVDLQKQYAVYVEKHCHLSYLEHQLDLVNQAEHTQNEVSPLPNDSVTRIMRMCVCVCVCVWIR